MRFLSLFPGPGAVRPVRRGYRSPMAAIERRMQVAPHRAARPTRIARRPLAVARRTDERTCVHCGSRATFLVDADGCWATCPACGRYA